MKFALLDGAGGNVMRGVAVLFMGSAAGRLVSMAAIPALTRIYSPADFGVLAVFTALVAVLTPVSTLRYPLALPLPRHDGMAMNIVVLSIGLMIIFCTATAILLWAWGAELLNIFSMRILEPWWWLITIGVFAASSYELLSLWATRKRAYRIIARTNVWQSGAGAIVKIVLGLAAYKPAGLLLGQLVTQSGGAGLFIRGFWSDFRFNWRFVRWSRIRTIAASYRGFPAYRAPSQLLMVLAQQIPLLFMAGMFDVQTTGQFGMALMILALPVSLIANSAANAFYAEAARLGARQSFAIKEMLRVVLVRLALCAVPPALLLYFGAERFVPLLVGPSWHQAAAFAATLSIYVLFQFIQTPVSYIFFLFDGQRALLLLNCQRIALILAVFGTARWRVWDAEATIWVYSLVLGLHFGLSIIYAWRFIPDQR